MSFKPTFRDVKKALDALQTIERPEGDNEGDPINSQTVYPLLKTKDQRRVDAAEIASEYVRNSDGTPNRRAIGTLNRNGYPIAFNEAQDDPLRMVGCVGSGDWELDLSDPVPNSQDE